VTGRDLGTCSAFPDVDLFERGGGGERALLYLPERKEERPLQSLRGTLRGGFAGRWESLTTGR